MDPQTMLIGACIVVVSAVVLYLISVCSMKEKTFEEVIAEQKQRQLLENQQNQPSGKSKSEKDKLKKRYRKGKGVAKGEESPKPAAVAVGVEEQKRKDSKVDKMVELELEPEIIQPVEEPTVKAEKPKKQKKEKPAKPILHNKEEKVNVQKSEVKVTETFHADRGATVVKDELELKHERELILKKAEEMEREKKEKERKKKEQKEVKVVEKAVEVEKIVRQEAQHAQAAPPPAKKAKKAKEAEPDVQTISKTGDLVTTIKMATMNDAEIQSLIEILLNKQGRGATPAQWTKKSKTGDPLSLLKKQLEDKERTLQEEQKTAEQAVNRLKEVKGEFAGEKQRFAMMQKQSQDKIEMQMEEIKALHARMQQTHEGHMGEANALKYQIEQYKGAANQGPLIQRLTEENKQLKDAMAKNQHSAHNNAELNGLRQQISIMNDELARNVMNLNKSDNAKKNLEAKLAQYEERLRAIDGQRDAETVLNRKLVEVSEALRQAEGRNKSLSDELKSAHGTRQELTNMNNTISSLQAEKSHNQGVMKQLETKLQSLEKIKVDTENRCKTFESKFTQLEKQHKEKDHELKMLKDENNALSSELKTTKERTAGEGQEAPVEAAVVESKQAVVGSAAPPTLTNGEFKGELQQKQKELDELRQEVEAQKEKNNVLREKNWKAMEALKQAEKQAETATAKDSQIEALTKQLQDAKKAPEASKSVKSAEAKSSEDVNNLQKSLLAKDAELCKIRQEINELKKENSDLRTGCEAATASLTKVEKSAEEIAAVQQQLKSSVSQVHSLQTSLQSKEKEISSLRDEVDTLEEKLEKGQGQTAGQGQGAESDAKNTELQQRIKELEGNLQFEEQKQTATEKHHRDTLQAMFPQVHISKSLSHKDWLSAFEKEVSSYISNLSAPSDSSPKKQSGAVAQDEPGADGAAQQSHLQSQIIHYQTVLADTENILHKLQESVEGEESRWTEKLRSKEDELSRAQELIRSLQSAQDNVSIPSTNGTNGTTDVAELKTKLAQTQKQLEKEIAANKQLTQKMGASEEGTSV